MGGLLAIAMAGCRAQSAPPTPAGSALDRKIEVLVRSQLAVPSDWSITVGSRVPSNVAGFDTITLDFTPPPTRP